MLENFVLSEWLMSKIGIILKIFSILWNRYRKWIIGNDDCVKLDIVNDVFDPKTNSLRFKLYIINNSNDRIKLKRLYIKAGSSSIKSVYILVAHAHNKSHGEPVKWKPFEQTYLMDKVLYSVNNAGSRKIDGLESHNESEISISGLKNVALPIPNCRAEEMQNINGIELILEYRITDNKFAKIAEVKQYLSLE